MRWSHYYLGLTAVIGFAMAVWVPKKEWQEVPDGVAIPGGLEVRLDVSSGGRWARLPAEESEEPQDRNVDVSADVQLDMDSLSELAHDFHHGEDIIATHGAQLARRWAQHPLAERSAARVLTTAVRNNPRAASEFAFDSLDQVNDADVGEASVLGLAGALASTHEGLRPRQTQNLLGRIRRHIEHEPLSPHAAVKLDSLLRSLAHTEPAATSEWAPAVQKAVLRSTDESSRLQTLKLAADLVGGTGEFPTAADPDPELVKWLADLVSKSGQGDLREFARSVRHRVFGNPKAERNHFDEL